MNTNLGDDASNTLESRFKEWNDSHSKEAFDRLYALLYPRVVLWLKCKGFKSDDPEDGANHAFAKAYGYPKPIYLTWLLLEAKKYLITSKKKFGNLMEKEELEAIPREDTQTSSKHDETSILQNAMKDCFDRFLGNRDVEAFKDIHSGRLCVKDLAVMRECTSDAVYNMVLRGKRRMIDCMRRKLK